MNKKLELKPHNKINKYSMKKNLKSVLL